MSAVLTALPCPGVQSAGNVLFSLGADAAALSSFGRKAQRYNITSD